MSAVRLVLIVVLALTFVPTPTAQAYSCTTFSQTRTIAGNSVTAALTNCEDSYSYGTYSQRYLTNDTRVTVDTTQNYRVVIDSYNYWGHYSDSSSGYEATQRSHSYQFYVQDMTYVQPFGGLVLGAGDNQYSSNNYGCSENLAGSEQAWSSEGSQYEAANVNMGDTRALPCTSDDIQQSLP